MPDDISTDVLIVGAGPAGATTALALARRGIRPLLVGPLVPPGESHDVLLSGPAVRALTLLDAIPRLPILKIDSAELRCGDGRPRGLAVTGSAACSDGALRGGLIRAATDAGATHLNAKATEIVLLPGGTHMVELSSGVTVTARHIVMATGAPSGSPNGTAVAQRLTGVRLDESIVMRLPAPATSDPRETPVFVWVTPSSEDSVVTVGTAQLGVQDVDLMARALRDLAATDPRFHDAIPIGVPHSGPLSSTFSPEAAVVNDRLHIGDAAGLANPFTGEGIGGAVESGLLAADCIADFVDDPLSAASAYRSRLAASYVGYFETARHAARRYHLTWRVLSATADSDRPFFAKARRTVLLPEGISSLTGTERMELPSAIGAVLAPFLAACDEIGVATIRGEWPFLARLLIAADSSPHERLRPAVPFYAALAAAGRPPSPEYAALGSAIELATLGAMVFLGPGGTPTESRGVDWSSTSVVLAGDFLLAQATRLVAVHAPDIAWSFSDWLGELAALRAERLDPGSGTPAEEVFSALLEFPARIGAQLGGADSDVVETLREYGRLAGRVFLHAEDMLSLRGRPTRLDATRTALAEGRVSDIDPAMPVAGALREAQASCGRASAAALAAVVAVPDETATHILRAFITALAPAPVCC
ncbi:lycopene cyclase family protein [Actinomadura harenae]|uniref:FAD-binding domain-containing protein n=1 Tax=Actinomadura harenae TaxID=2483351 RepID=A0A3M2MC69_9ACTN|nr:lycopene cyclase family protein [Actinomadura harenae]RMI46610.1 hypothetical protein EBO15_06710 [Actinomadura harenae]